MGSKDIESKKTQSLNCNEYEFTVRTTDWLKDKSFVSERNFLLNIKCVKSY